MKRRSLWPAILFALVAVLLAAALRHSLQTGGGFAVADRRAGPFRLAALDNPGAALSLDDLNAQPVSVVNFWASWCTTCREEMPQLMALQRESGVPIYGINYKDPHDAAAKFLQEHGNPFAKTGIDDSGRTAVDWGVYGVPETFIMIVYKRIGAITEESLREVILPKIKELSEPKP